MDAYIWFGLMVVFLIIEAACPLHLVSIWFAVGALVAAVAGWLHGPVWLQILLFLLVSGVLLALLWPFVRRFLNPKLEKTNIDSIIGNRAIVTGAIDNIAAQGQVKLNGMEWTARSTDGAPIAPGTLVQVDKIEGVKVFVSPVAEHEAVV